MSITVVIVSWLESEAHLWHKLSEWPWTNRPSLPHFPPHQTEVVRAVCRHLPCVYTEYAPRWSGWMVEKLRPDLALLEDWPLRDSGRRASIAFNWVPTGDPASSSGMVATQQSHRQPWVNQVGHKTKPVVRNLEKRAGGMGTGRCC